ncbi:MAG: hypothetical protein QOH88_746 [Verrucomicrobiota bacterium]|jgi:hypothetical protein
MISASRAGLIALCSLIVLEPALVRALPQHSVSTSRQFIVYGPELRLRGAICDLAEDIKRDLLQLIDQRDGWTTPIVINLEFPQANLPDAPRTALNFSQTGGGLKLQLDLTIVSDVTQPRIRRELLRAILLEMMYRGQTNIPAGTAYVPPPDWLLDGVLSQPVESSELPGLLDAPVRAKRLLPLAEFLRQRPDLLDTPGRSLYRAYSLALVELLTRGPDGRHRLARFIASLASASNDAMSDLRSHFPELFATEESAEKAWTAGVARLAAGRSYQLLSAEETERSLEQLLHLKVTTAGSEKWYRLDQFAAFIRQRFAKPLLIMLTRELSILAARSSPIYQPIILEYADVTARLARGKTNRIGERLARLASSRQTLAARMREIDDYMNWFEVTKPRGPSGAFDDYLRAAELAEQRPRLRRDPISLYLDALETQFQN